MILRRISFERFGCFGSADFEFRRGMNLIGGGNESGKSLLLTALPAAVFGVEHGSRLRSWGETLNCRVTLLFEGSEGRVRLSRDLENNLVRLEEGGLKGDWRESFAGKVPPAKASPERDEYFGCLMRLFSVHGEALLRVHLDAVHADAALTGDGGLTEGLVPTGFDDYGPVPQSAPVASSAQRQREIAELEAELASDREDYRKGQEYLAWIRKRWEREVEKVSAAASGKSAKKDAAALERKRDEMLAKLKSQGLPANLPADLPAMFETAEGLRQELAALQLELTPLQRRKSAIVMPGMVLPLLAALVGVAAPVIAFWQKIPWWLPLAVGCGSMLLLVWGVFLVRLSRARKDRDLLDQQLQAVEVRRADALVRQGELAEQFEFRGLPSAPVEMVKLEQVYRRNEDLIHRYRDVCAQLGGGGGTLSSGDKLSGDRHLRPDELPEAEARLAELGESLIRREARLAALRDGSAPADVTGTAVSPLCPTWTESQLVQTVSYYLERLTAGRHREIRQEENRLRLEAAPGRWASPASCSRGTIDALVLAIRLACAKLSGGCLPLLIDDLPVHLDSKRQQATLRELERFAADHQLLFASCDEELLRRAGRERWHIINLKATPTERATAKEDDDAGQLHLL